MKYRYSRLSEPSDCSLSTETSPANGGICRSSMNNEFPRTKTALLLVVMLQGFLALILIKYGLNQLDIIQHKLDDISAGRMNREHNTITASNIAASFNKDNISNSQKEQILREIYVTPEGVRFVSNDKNIGN